MSDREYFVHKKALCETNSVGKGTRLWAFSHVMENVVIGKDCNIGGHVFVESGVKIGNNVTVKNGISIWEGVEIEDDVFLGPNCVLTNDLLPRSKLYHAENVKTFIKKGSSIGANATILCGITLGEYCMIGAGAVVTKSVSPFSLVVGNPARFKYFVSIKGDKLVFDKENIALDSDNNKYKLAMDGTVQLLSYTT
jgi:UDP-2-acetamido-3-amino-2,3-dideoxy-glucuronate N-acetyltransferase